MQTFHISINLEINQRGSRVGYKPLHLLNKAQISG